MHGRVSGQMLLIHIRITRSHIYYNKYIEMYLLFGYGIIMIIIIMNILIMIMIMMMIIIIIIIVIIIMIVFTVLCMMTVKKYGAQVITLIYTYTQNSMLSIHYASIDHMLWTHIT